MGVELSLAAEKTTKKENLRTGLCSECSKTTFPSWKAKNRQVFITKSLENQFPGFEWSFNSISTIETYISMIFQDFIIAFPALSKV